MQENMIKVFVLNNEKYISSIKEKIKGAELNIISDKELQKLKEEIPIDEKNNLYNDYLRSYILFKNGGLILDGKIEIMENLDFFFNNNLFFSYKTENEIATNIMYSKEKGNKYLEQILKIIEEGKFKNITEVLSEVFSRNLGEVYNSLVKFENGVYIYPYDYFYPLDYEKHGKNISENTKAIFYEKKPLNKFSKIKCFIYKKHGNYALRYLLTLTDSIRSKIGIKKYIKKKSTGKFENPKEIKESVLQAVNILDGYKEKNIEYVIFHNPRWMGVTSATKELFENLVPLQGTYTNSQVDLIANKVVGLGVKQVVFSGYEFGFDTLARRIKSINKNIKIKLFWHGSNSQFTNQIVDIMNWKNNLKVIDLYREGVIDAFATCKESLVKFYKSQGIKTAFLKNTVRIDKEVKKEILNEKNIENDSIKIGLYASGMSWIKNMFNQIAGASLIENAVIDSVPLNFEGQVLASKIGVAMQGSSTGVKREELFKRIASNKINLYITFSECAPMLPIESMECSTLCLTGNNHHYFKDTELEKYLVISREDDVIAIANKIKIALDNEEKIFELYKEWKKNYDLESKKSVQEFLAM